MTNSPLGVILFCPTGQDSGLIAKALSQVDISSRILQTVDELTHLDFEKEGVLVIADEALPIEATELLNKRLLSQATWSDIPIILLTAGNGRTSQMKHKRLEDFVSSGNVILLERPFQPLTLISSVQVAIRSRARQFQVQELMISQLEATKIRDEFISIASHELKTPLTSLKLQTQMSMRQMRKSETFSTEKIQRQLDSTIYQIDRLNALVDDMLDVSRINSGKLSLNRTEVELSKLLAGLVERFTPQFEAVGIFVTAQIESDVTGKWDSYKLEQVINNLFSNAIRYSSHQPVKIKLQRSPSKAILTVEDQGMGIHPEKIERIFDRFERASTVESGLGLGLYITRQILDLHKGSIRVESVLGEGSKFTIELPL